MLRTIRDKLTALAVKRTQDPFPDEPAQPGTDDTATDRPQAARSPVNDRGRSAADRAVSEEQRQLKTGEELPG